MSLLAVGRYKEPYTRLPTKLPNLNRLSVPATPVKDVISSGGNPISYAPAAVPARTINIFNELERKEPKQKRISDLMDLFLQVQKNKFIKEGVIQQAFKPEKHSNSMNYLASTNPDRAKEKMINSIQEALDTRTYNKPDGRLQLLPTEDIKIQAEELIKADPNIDATEFEKQLEKVDEKIRQEKRLEQALKEIDFTPTTKGEKRYVGEIMGSDNIKQLEDVFNKLQRGSLDKERKKLLYPVFRDRYFQFRAQGALSSMAMDEGTEKMISTITGSSTEMEER